jgi:hypothetical protein
MRMEHAVDKNNCKDIMLFEDEIVDVKGGGESD